MISVLPVIPASVETPLLISYIVTFILQMSKYCYNNLHDFIGETYATHVVRSLLEVLSGITSSSKGSKKAQTKHQLSMPQAKKHIQVPAELTEILLMIVQRLMKVSDLPSKFMSDTFSYRFLVSF